MWNGHILQPTPTGLDKFHTLGKIKALKLLNALSHFDKVTSFHEKIENITFANEGIVTRIKDNNGGINEAKIVNYAYLPFKVS